LYGGNAWEHIAAEVIELVNALRAGDNCAAAQLFATIRAARHNTGRVSEKLTRLGNAEQTSRGT